MNHTNKLAGGAFEAWAGGDEEQEQQEPEQQEQEQEQEQEQGQVQGQGQEAHKALTGRTDIRASSSRYGAGTTFTA
jgi:hypothetical protein